MGPKKINISKIAAKNTILTSNQKSFIFDTKKNIVKSDVATIKVNYDVINVNKSDGSVGKSNGESLIKLNYRSSGSTPNLSYPEPNSGYKLKNMYIHGVIHNNVLKVTTDSNGNNFNSEIVGELVLEFSSLTREANAYVCYFLVNDSTLVVNSQKNDIDSIVDLISGKKNKSINISTNLNNTVSQQSETIIYKNKSDVVIVYTNPISINSNTAATIRNFATKTTLFPTSPVNRIYETLNAASIESSSGDDIWIDCNPTGESNETIATYNVPINSEYTQNAAKLDLMSMTLHLVVLSFFMALSYFLVPTIYKKLVIDSVNKFVTNPARFPNSEKDRKDLALNRQTDYSKEYLKSYRGMTEQQINEDKSTRGIDTFVRIASADAWITFLTFVFFVVFITKKSGGKMDFASVAAGVYLVIFYILSYTVIQLRKLDSSFLQTKTDKGVVDGEAYPSVDVKKGEDITFFQIGDFFKLLMLSVLFIVKGFKMYNAIAIFILYAITVIILVCFWQIKGPFQLNKDYFIHLLIVTAMTIFIAVPSFSIMIMTRKDWTPF
jgi:hypothetical protein